MDEQVQKILQEIVKIKHELAELHRDQQLLNAARNLEDAHIRLRFKLLDEKINGIGL